MMTRVERANHERMAKRDWNHFRKSNFEFIDPEIKSAVLELNRKGHYTSESCAGHPNARHAGYRRGIVWIWRMYDGPEVISILKNHGLKGIKKSHPTKDHVQYSFNPVGRPQSSSFG